MSDSAITNRKKNGDDGCNIMLNSLSKIDIKYRCAVCLVLSVIGIWTINLLDFPVGAIGLIPSLIGVLAKLCPPVNEPKKTARSKRAERELL